MDKEDIIIKREHDITQSQDEVRMTGNSPLEVRDGGLTMTQVLKTTYKGEEAVIHEVEEENNPEDHIDAKRHSLLQADETKENFKIDVRI